MPYGFNAGQELIGMPPYRSLILLDDLFCPHQTLTTEVA